MLRYLSLIPAGTLGSESLGSFPLQMTARPMLDSGANPTKESWTPLHNAAQVGNVKAPERLLKVSAKANITTSCSMTALHCCKWT